jgi:hypothetical protein
MSLLFLTPAILASLTALGIPVLLHLRPHTKAKRIPFAAMRFLHPALRRTSRRLRIQNLLLLLARLLVFTLFILALARPVLRRTGGAVGETEGPTDLVVVLDATLSMNCREGPMLRFERARARGGEFLDALEEGDNAALVVAGLSAEVVVDLTPDFGKVRDGLEQAQPTLSASSICDAISLSANILRKSEAPNKEICVVSDRQQATWSGKVAGLASDKDEAINVYVVDVGAEGLSNLGILKTETPDEVRQTGDPVPLCVTVGNFGTADTTVLARLSIDSRSRAEKSLEVPAAGSATAGFHFAFDEPGLHQGFFQVEGDPLDPDNRRYFTVTVHEGVPVLCVDGDPSAVAFKSETYFLSCALSPGGKGESHSPFLPKVAPLADLPGQDFSIFSAVILANAPRLEANEVSKLKAYVNAGGRLLVFPGDRTEKNWHNQVLGFPPDESLIPARLGNPVGKPEGAEGRTLKEYDVHHPIFIRFRDNTYGDLSTFRFDTVYSLELGDFPDSRVLAKFSDGLPALVEANRGLGKIVLAAFPIDSDWGNLPLKTAYLPFVHELTRFMSGGTQLTRDYRIGEQIPFSLDLTDFGTSITVTTPRGRSQTLRAVLQGNLAVAHFRETDEAGIYRVQLEGTEREKPSQFAVNTDPKESDLAKAPEEMVRSMLQGARVSFVGEKQPTDVFLQRERTGIRLSIPLLYAAFAVYLIESFLSGRFAPRPAETEKEESRVARLADVSVRAESSTSATSETQG